MANSDGQDRDKVADILLRLGTWADIDPYPVVLLLSHADAGVRAKAAEVLGRMGAPASEHAFALVPLLADPKDNVWQTAIAALPKLGEAGRRAVSKALHDANAHVRKRGALSALKMGDAAKELLPDLIARIEDEDENSWSAVEDVLVGLGKFAAHSLARRLGTDDQRILLRAIKALQLMGDDGVFAVARYRAPTADVEATAISARASWVCQQLGAAGARTLAAWLDSFDPGIRVSGITGLTEGDADVTAPHLGAVAERLADHDAHVASVADEAFRGLGATGASFLARFGRTAQSPEVRACCLKSLSRMGEEAVPLVEFMIDALQDEDVTVQIAAAEALTPSASDDSSNVAALAPFAVATSLAARLCNFGFGDGLARRRVEEVLEKSGKLGIFAMLPYLDNTQTSEVRVHAARALGRITSSPRVCECREQLQVDEIKAKVADCLGHQCAFDREPSARRAAADAISLIGKNVAANALEACAGDLGLTNAAASISAIRPRGAVFADLAAFEAKTPLCRGDDNDEDPSPLPAMPGMWLRRACEIDPDAWRTGDYATDVAIKLARIKSQSSDQKEAIAAKLFVAKSEGSPRFKPKNLAQLAFEKATVVTIAPPDERVAFAEAFGRTMGPFSTRLAQRRFFGKTFGPHD